MNDLIGVRVNGYVIRRLLAKGGMSAVYVAEHIELPLQKAVKVLLPYFAHRHDIRARFAREAKAVSMLHHPNILGIDDCGQLEDGQLWYMMQLLEGQSLEEFLRARGRLSEAHALPIILQLCRALEHAHRHNVVHRDLKPENVFLCETGVKLLDFGIAKIVGTADGARTAAGSTVGTPHYMSPEQNGQAHLATPLSDIYSLGVLVCKMVTGRLPWGVHDYTVLYHLQRTQLPQLDGLPPRWKDAVASALSTLPSRRPQSVRAFVEAFTTDTEGWHQSDHLSCSGEITPPPSPFAIGSGRWGSDEPEPVVATPTLVLPTKRRSPLFFILAVCLLLGVAAVTAFVVWVIAKHVH